MKTRKRKKSLVGYMGKDFVLFWEKKNEKGEKYMFPVLRQSSLHFCPISPTNIKVRITIDEL